MAEPDPAVQAAIEAARTMQRRWHSDDTEAVCRAAVEAARPIIVGELAAYLEARGFPGMADDMRDGYLRSVEAEHG